MGQVLHDLFNCATLHLELDHVWELDIRLCKIARPSTSPDGVVDTVNYRDIVHCKTMSRRLLTVVLCARTEHTEHSSNRGTVSDVHFSCSSLVTNTRGAGSHSYYNTSKLNSSTACFWKFV